MRRMTTMDVKARESRLRRLAERRGLALEKSKRRNREAPDFGRFRLVDVIENRHVFGGEPFAFSASVDQVQEWFEEHPEVGSDGAVTASIVKAIKDLDRIERMAGGPVPLCGPIASAKSGEP
jgi:hypothetical protein